MAAKEILVRDTSLSMHLSKNEPLAEGEDYVLLNEMGTYAEHSHGGGALMAAPQGSRYHTAK